MKKTILLSLISFLMLSCNCKKNVSQENKDTKAQILSSCPEDYECTLEVFPNKTMIIKTDGIGATFFELEDFNGTTVYHYTYNQKTDKQYQDAGYKEEIIFEFNSSNTTDLKLSNKELQNTKMLFGVWCYCKGKAGNYKITKGNFSKKGNEISIDFPAVVDNQKVTELKIKI